MTVAESDNRNKYDERQHTADGKRRKNERGMQ